MAGTENGERRTELQILQPVARAKPQIEEFDETFKLRPEEDFVVGAEDHRLSDPGANLDENELRSKGGAGRKSGNQGGKLVVIRAFGVRRSHGAAAGSGAKQGQISDDLKEVLRIVGPERGFFSGQRTGDGLDLPDDDPNGWRSLILAGGRKIENGDYLVDAAVEDDLPSAVDGRKGQRHFKGGVGPGARAIPERDLSVRLAPKLGVPLLAQLRPPQARRSPRAGIARAERKAGKLADAQGAAAVIEGELHGGKKGK